MKCPKYKFEKSFKNGIIKGKQRFKCKKCGCNYTVGYEQVSEKEIKEVWIIHVSGMFRFPLHRKVLASKSYNSNELGS